MTFEKTRQVLHRYCVDELSINQIKKILNKISLNDDENDDKDNVNIPNDEDASDFSDFLISEPQNFSIKTHVFILSQLLMN